mmetsp:Transcript_26598/g.34572  ORF Transcript_26598/g.34572 Transcript_26598/m.34572 type:complete len:293 (+) Transcript_26598:106-984(+)
MSFGNILISYKCDEFEIIDVEFKTHEEVTIFMSWCSLTKQQYAMEQNIIKKFISGQSIKEDNIILAELSDRAEAYENEQLQLQLQQEPEQEQQPEQEPKQSEPEPLKPITIDDINETFKNGVSYSTSKPFAKGTIKNYINAFKNIHNHFKLNDYREVLNDPKSIIEYIYEKFESDSTKKLHLSSLLYIIKTLCPNDSNEIKINHLTKVLHDNLTTKRSNDMDNNKQDIGKAYALMAFMEQKNDDVFARMVLNYGVLRPDELYNLRVLDTDNDDDNYINISTKMLIINKHKTL